MKNVKSNTMIGVLIGILSIISLVSVGYIIYDKFIKEEEFIENGGNNQTNEGNENNNVVADVKVVDGINYIDSYYKQIKVTIPEINSNATNAKKLNKQMSEEILKDTYRCAATIETYGEYDDFGSKDYIIDYEYIIKNNIIVIYATNTYGDLRMGSGDGVYRYNYFYDIEKDRILSWGEALPLIGYTKDDLTKLEVTSFEEIDTGCSYYEIKNGTGTLKYISITKCN